MEGVRGARAKAGRAVGLVSRRRLLRARKPNKRARCQGCSGAQRSSRQDLGISSREGVDEAEGSGVGEGRWLWRCRGRCEGHGRPLISVGSNLRSALPLSLASRPGLPPRLPELGLSGSGSGSAGPTAEPSTCLSFFFL